MGEIAIDRPHRAKEVLEKYLPKLEDDHILVIHNRGMKDDFGTEAFLLLLHFLKKYVQNKDKINK